MTQFFARKLNKKGFTLAELLIVVAIIAVLVAIAIPIFNNSLVRTRYGVHYSNGRALKSMAIAEMLTSSEFTAADINDQDLFVAWGSYDFETEQFRLNGITRSSSTEKKVGIWAQQGDGVAAGLFRTNVEGFDTSKSQNGKWYKFDDKNISSIGKWGTGATSEAINYIISFKGIELSTVNMSGLTNT